MKKIIVPIILAATIIGNALSVSPIATKALTSDSVTDSTIDNNDLERTGDLIKQFIAEQKYKGNLAFRLANVYSQEDLRDTEGSIPEPFMDKIVVEYYHPDRESFLKSVYDFMEDNNISEDLVLFIELQESGVVSTTDLMTLTPDSTNTISSTTEKIDSKGDTNCDGQIDMADAVLIMQALANPNKYGIDGTAEYHLTEQGKLNGDMDCDGLTVGDAQAIQRKLLGLYEALTDLDSIRKMISDFFTENNMCFSVVPTSQMPELLRDKYIFLSTNSYNTDDVIRFTGFIQKNNIDDAIIKSIPYYLNDDSIVNKISQKLFYFILENNIPATMYYVDEAKSEREKSVFVKYSESDSETREKIEAFLAENGFDANLIEYYAYE